MTTQSLSAATVAFLVLLVSGCGQSDEGPTGGFGDAGENDCAEHEPVTTESGLTYVDLSCGDGEDAVRGSAVTVHYTGTLEDGTTFDSSLERNEPFRFVLGAGDVLKGWDEGIAGMQVGGERELTIPPDLGYGSTGYPPVIPPRATLTYEVELLEVEAGT